MRYLGIDLGDKRIGLAVSDPSGLLATPLGVYQREYIEADIAFLAEKLNETKAQEVVLGLPRNMDGSYGERAQIVRNFGQKLAEALGVKVHYYDERLSTIQAERVLLAADMSRKKRRKVIDKLAAQLILQGFLDQRCQQENNQATRGHNV